MATDTPELRIPVIDENGVAGTLPSSQIGDAVFRDKKFTLAPASPFKPADIGKDGRINVVDSKGVAGTLPIDQADDTAFRPVNKGGGGFILQSDHDNFNSPEVQKNIELIKKADPIGDNFFTQDHPELSGNEAYRQLNREHRGDNVVDRESNYTMTGNGVNISVPNDMVHDAQRAGYKFADSKFQALYDAHVYLQLTDPDQQSAASGIQGVKGAIGSLPIVSTLIKAAKRHDESDWLLSDNNLRATSLTTGDPRIEERYKTSHTVGTGLGLAAQVLAPEGLFGEVALAGKAGKAVLGARGLAESPLIASALSNAVKGMVIAGPQVADALINNNPKLAAESLGIGALGGVVFGELPNLINGTGRKVSALAGERLPGMADKALASVGAEEGFLKLDAQAKQKVLDAFMEAGLKESSNAESTLKVLNKVSGGSGISVLGKLDQVAEEKILTSNISSDLMQMVHGENGIAKVSPELESALTSLNHKMDKLFPEGTGTLSEVQKVVGELSSDITKVRAASEVNNFNIQARDMLMNEVFRLGDQAAMKADAKTVALWGEQKAIAQAATEMQSGFASQISAAEQLAGASLAPSIKDKLIEGTIKHFFRATGAVAGHAIVPFVGGHIGSKLGSEAFESLAPYLKSVLPEGAAKSWLIKNADNPNISSYLTMNAIHNTNVNVAKIPEFIKAPAIKTALFANNSDPIKSILGTEANGLSKNQQFDRLSNKIAMLAGNDQLRDQYLTSVSSVLAKNHPELAQSLKQELDNKIKVVNQLLHSGNTAQPTAFQKPGRYAPSKDKMAEIEAGLNVIENPYSILSGLKNGKVSQKQVALVQQTHPAIFQEIVNQVNKEAYSGNTTLNHQERLSASIITGQPMDASLKIGSALQATYNAPNAGPAQASPGHTGKGRKAGNSKSLHADKISSYTTAQRISK